MVKVGDKIPFVVFKIFKDGNFKDLSTKDIFDGKAVVVFGLPGAFTPTCSSKHLPGYSSKKSILKSLGVDHVYCHSVNDSFVMNAWAKAQQTGSSIFMIPDGNADFAKAIGVDVNKNAIGFGTRSWRYSMLVQDGIIKAIFEEDRTKADGDPFEVSDAETMVEYLRKNPIA